MAAVRYWLLRDPLASWRRLIERLDYWADVIGYGRYNDIADRIRHYAEELTGMCFSCIEHYMYRGTSSAHNFAHVNASTMYQS